MSTDAITASALRTLEGYQKKSSKSGSNLDMDDFLQLFVAQMSCQDPLSGSSGSGSNGTDYIAQLAQLTMLEQISSLGSALSTTQAYSLIGKYVYIGEDADADMVFGKVDGVIGDGGVNYLMVGGETYDMSEIFAVVNEDAVSTASDDEVLQCAGLIGKTVSATVTADDGSQQTVAGVVEKICVQDGTIYLVVGGENVAFGNITEISETLPETTTV
jgi:hypothetical protein